VSCVLIVFFTLHVSIWTATSPSEQKTSLLWSFAAITGAENQGKLVAITSDSVLYSGDKFKLMFEVQETLFVYIIFAGSDGEIVLLHPTKIESGIRPAAVNKAVFIPNEKDWFTLDQKRGTETLYLVVSSSHLADLELLLKRYEAASLDDRDKIAQAIVGLMKEKNRASQPLTAAVEKPIQIGGTIRSISERGLAEADISKFAQRIDIEALFIRIYSIEHL
jgi:hypothetical protein